MKISYQRGMQKNFMIVDPEELNWDGYECNMLLHNNIDGLLRMRVRPTEHGAKLYYDITSRQPLCRMMKGAQWKADEFRDLMIQICGTLTRMHTYLLKESCVLLDSEYIYLEPGTGRIFFCYVPGMERSFSEDLGRLLEELLECVDHRDKECVVLAYGLYQETRKENYGMEDLLKQIYSRPAADEKEPAQGEYDYETEFDEFPMHDASVREEKAPGFFERLKDKVFTRLPKTDEDDEDDLWFEGLDEVMPEEKETPKETVIESGHTDTDRERMSLTAGDTMILTGLKSAINIHVLKALDAGIADIPLTYYPFVIGKQYNMVDCCLSDDTVSRLHLKVEKKDDRYTIQDLNSTNGTSLNGELLENNEEREISTGDVIGIARLRFRFE